MKLEEMINTTISIVADNIAYLKDFGNSKSLVLISGKSYSLTETQFNDIVGYLGTSLFEIGDNTYLNVSTISEVGDNNVLYSETSVLISDEDKDQLKTAIENYSKGGGGGQSYNFTSSDGSIVINSVGSNVDLTVTNKVKPTLECYVYNNRGNFEIRRTDTNVKVTFDEMSQLIDNYEVLVKPYMYSYDINALMKIVDKKITTLEVVGDESYIKFGFFDCDYEMCCLYFYKQFGGDEEDPDSWYIEENMSEYRRKMTTDYAGLNQEDIVIKDNLDQRITTLTQSDYDNLVDEDSINDFTIYFIVE